MKIYENIKAYAFVSILVLAVMAPPVVWAVQKYDDIIVFMSVVQAVLCYRILKEIQGE